MYNSLKNENKEKYSSLYMRGKLSYIILQCSYLDSDKKEFKEILDDIRTYEKETNFNTNLDVKWADIINKCILNKHYTTAIFLLKLIANIRKVTILRKISRKIK